MENGEHLTRYIRRCKAEDLKPETIKINKHIINHFIEWCDNRSLDSFTEDDVFDYLEFLDCYTYTRKGIKCSYTESTKQHRRITIRKFLNFVNPKLGNIIKIKAIKNDKLPDSLFTHKEIEGLLDACLTVRDKAMIATFYESGARKGELLSVKLKHLNFDEYGCIINIPKGKTGSRRIRLVFASSYLRQWVDCHPLKDNREAFLFCSLHTPFNVISDTGMFLQLRVLGKRAGIPQDKLYWHNMRHSRATELAQKLTEAQLKQYLGWVQSSTMSSVYVHLSGKNMDDAILAMNGIEVKEKNNNSLKVMKCPRCKDLNPERALYCGKCGLPLKDEMRDKIEKDVASIDLEVMKAAILNPEILKEISRRIEK